ncbi:MAG: DUF6477 family protein [Yoonia sp.]|nr:DUF6477 family protein [Yoonia sp.]
MLDIQSSLARLQRPKILINAARFGLDDYTRGTHLSRILKMIRPRNRDRPLCSC